MVQRMVPLYQFLMTMQHLKASGNATSRIYRRELDFNIAIISSIVYAFVSPWLINHLVSDFTTSEKPLTLLFSQIIFFSLVVLGPFAVLLAALFALKEFGWPAFATASYHAGIILGAIVFYFVGSHSIGPLALPIGLLLGATGQLVLLLPGIRHQRLTIYLCWTSSILHYGVLLGFTGPLQLVMFFLWSWFF